VAAWAESRSDVDGVAIVGSCARGTAEPTSDIDFVILSKDPSVLLQGDWLARFGDVQSSSIENYGALKACRILYRSGLEVEFGVAAPRWASIPLDLGTKRVLTDGVKVLYDPQQLFRAANTAAGA
jgi:uncharacterized protein